MTKPTAAANAAGLPEDRAILFAYRQWLKHEGDILGEELFPELGQDASRFIPETFARHFHFPLDRPWTEVEKPSTRARTILEAVGAMPKDVASIECLAETEFEPWDKGGCEFPSNEKLVSYMEASIVSLCFAWKIAHSPKAEIVKALKTLGEDLGARMKDDFISSIDWMASAIILLEAAEARLLCAGAVIELEERDAEVRS